MLAPSYLGSEPSPATKPPPKKYTSTGIPFAPYFAGVHTFKYRQSSLKPSDLEFMSPYTTACTGRGANFFVCSTSFQLLKGCGAFHLRLPTGGFAKGIPKYSCKPALVL